ncbi:MAG: VOC family protein [Candidatus Eremiobacteraeota bacterium]|nr:VOC family protein [Candidatus Eremiobacteraeota bacterium]
MYISVVTLRVKDVDRAIDFYTKKLGWEKTMDAPMGEDRWVTVAPKGGQASFTLSKDDADKAPSDMSGFILEVDDVRAAHERLSKRGIEFTHEPSTEPWGGWAMFKDSEGNVLGLHSPVAAGVSHN